MNRLKFLSLVALLCCKSLLVLSQTLYPVFDGKKWGYIDGNGNQKIANQFDKASSFKYGFARVDIDSETFLINSQGKTLSVHGMNLHQLLQDKIIFNTNNQFGFCSYSGEILKTADFSEIEAINNGLWFLVKQNNLYGILDSSLQFIVEPIYQSITFSNRFDNFFFWCTHNEASKSGIYCVDSKLFLLGEFEDYMHVCNRQFVKQKKKWHPIDSASTVFDQTWEEIIDYNDYYSAIFKKDTILFYAPTNEAIDTNWGFVSTIFNNHLVINNNGVLKILLNGKYLPETLEYARVQSNYLQVSSNGIANLLDSNLVPLLPNVYSSVYLLNDDFIQVSTESGIGVFGFLAKKELIAPRMSQLSVSDNVIKGIDNDGNLWFFELENKRVVDSAEFTNHNTLESVRMGMDANASGIVNNLVNQSGVWFIEKSYWGLRSPSGEVWLKPQFSYHTAVEGSPFSFVFRQSYYSTKSSLFTTYCGIVDHTIGKIVVPLNYTYIDTKSLSDPNLNVFQARKASGEFVLIHKGNFKEQKYQSPFIDDFVNGRARIYLKGSIDYLQPPSYKNIDMALDFANKYNYSIAVLYQKASSFMYNRYRSSVMVTFVGGTWNYVDADGNLLLSRNDISFAEPFDPDNAVVYKWDTCALINRDGQYLTSFDNINIDRVSNDSGSLYKLTKWTDAYHYYNNKGQRINNSYSEGSKMHDGLALVKSDNASYVLKANGEMIKTEVPVYAFRKEFDNGLVPVRLNRGWGILDSNGSQINDKPYKNIAWCSGNYAAIKISEKKKSGKRKNGFIIIDTDGNPLNDEFYSKTFAFKGDVAIVANGNKKYGLINTAGETICKPKYRKMAYQKNESMILAKKHLWGVVGSNGEMIVKPRYKTVKIDQHAILAYRNKILTVYDPAGNKLKKIYNVSKYGAFADGRAMVQLKNKNGHTGYINQKGDWVIEPKFNYGTDFGNGLALVCLKREYHCIDTFGNILPKVNIQNRPRYSEGSILIYRNNVWEYLDAFGKPLCKMKFTFAEPFKNGLAKVKIGDYYGVINHFGDIVLPIEYTRIWIGDDNEITALKNHSYELIDGLGKKITTNTYDNITYDEATRIFTVFVGEIPEYLTFDGNWLWKKNAIAVSK
ncbi:MAG: WG repeat-containing protein [Flavobacteriales bacterium]|nr:WG repeat-containing protein [Flavobacteriales bacterium]